MLSGTQSILLQYSVYEFSLQKEFMIWPPTFAFLKKDQQNHRGTNVIG